MGKHAKTLERMRGRVDQLIGDLEHYVDVFERAKLFTGPSLYFHTKTLALRRQMSAAQALENDACQTVPITD